MAGGVTVREFSFAAVVGGSFAVFVRNLVPFLFLALLLTAPRLIYDLVVPEPELAPGERAGLSLRRIIALLIDVVCAALLGATLVYGTVQELRGQRASIGASVGQGMRVILPAVGVSLIAGIGIGLGLILLIVPGLILYTMWWVAVPATVVERPGGLAGLGRSVELTRGFRWTILGIVVVFGVAAGLIMLLFGLLVATRVMRGDLDPVVFLVMAWAVTAVIAAYGAVLSGVGYFALRVHKEGADLDQVAAVFD